MEEHSLLGRGLDEIMSFSPPLTITKEEIDFVVDQTKKVITQLEKEF